MSRWDLFSPDQRDNSEEQRVRQFPNKIPDRGQTHVKTTFVCWRFGREQLPRFSAQGKSQNSTKTLKSISIQKKTKYLKINDISKAYISKFYAKCIEILNWLKASGQVEQAEIRFDRNLDSY